MIIVLELDQRGPRNLPRHEPPGFDAHHAVAAAVEQDGGQWMRGGSAVTPTSRNWSSQRQPYATPWLRVVTSDERLRRSPVTNGPVVNPVAIAKNAVCRCVR